MEPSSSISFTSPSHLSNGSIYNNNMVQQSSGGSETGYNLDIISLNKLSSNLEQLLCDSSDSNYTDADIVVENTTVGVHRCILASRSNFFHQFFSKDKSGSKEGKLRFVMTDLLPYGKVGYEAFLMILSYLYTGKLKPFPIEMTTCVDDQCVHDACRPAIDFAVELMYASAIFQVPELVSLFQRRLISFVGKAIVEDIIPILMVAFHCQLKQLRTQCIHKVALSDFDLVSIEKELPPKVLQDIIPLRPSKQENNVIDPLQEKSVKRILKALDSHDIELLRLLLTESDTTLDEAYALHYAVAYCDPKIVSEVLSLGMADVNLRNTMGNTVIHVAARRKEPSIIVSLLNKGACAFKTTLEGQTAVGICKRLTRPKDYNMKREQGQEGNKDRLCIDVLEREMRPVDAGDHAAFSSLEMDDDDLHRKLLYLEDRVAFARMFFPTEAKLAMEIAHAETTSSLAGLLSSRGGGCSSGSLMEEVDLNETPITQNKRLLSKIETLSKTVELGRRYFPNCSQVLDKFMVDDLPDAYYPDKGTSQERKIKRMRFMELKNQVHKAFDKDKAELQRFGFSSSSSASSFKDHSSNKIRKL